MNLFLMHRIHSYQLLFDNIYYADYNKMEK